MTTVFSDVIKPKGRLKQIDNGEVLWNIYIENQDEKNLRQCIVTVAACTIVYYIYYHSDSCISNG